MAVVFQRKRRIQQYLILAFIVALITSALVLWYGFRGKGKGEEALPQEGTAASTIFPQGAQAPLEIPFLTGQALKINFEVLQNALVEKMEPLEKIKPFEGQAGRENPFIPY